MLVSQKCQYALRALFELAKREGNGPVRIADIAEAQAIPVRFLEAILGQLKHAGYVQSQRGARGGYLLVRLPEELTVGEVIRFIEGPLGPVTCTVGKEHIDCPMNGDCVFLPMWQRANEAVADVYDTTSFLDLVRQEERKGKAYVPCYAI